MLLKVILDLQMASNIKVKILLCLWTLICFCGKYSSWLTLIMFWHNVNLVLHTQKSTANSVRIRNSSFIPSFLLSMSIKLNFEGWYTSKFIFKSSEPSVKMTHSKFSNYIGQCRCQTILNIGEFRPFLFSR